MQFSILIKSQKMHLFEIKQVLGSDCKLFS